MATAALRARIWEVLHTGPGSRARGAGLGRGRGRRARGDGALIHNHQRGAVGSVAKPAPRAVFHELLGMGSKGPTASPSNSGLMRKRTNTGAQNPPGPACIWAQAGVILHLNFAPCFPETGVHAYIKVLGCEGA